MKLTMDMTKKFQWWLVLVPAECRFQISWCSKVSDL